MADNKFFTIDTSDPNYNEIINDIVESGDTIRKSLDLSLAVVKLPIDNVIIPEVLSGYTCYNHAQIIPIVTSDDWQINDL